MGVLDFNAYRLEYLHRGSGYYDEHGDYHPGNEIWVSVGCCNAVPAGRSNVINLPDGAKETFSFVIILHTSRSREFKYGENIRLTTINGMEKIDLVVKGFARYQHQCKVYA